MTPSLPPRPNLDHLRSQAKDLLAAARQSGDPEISTLSDAQGAVARTYGFASWPKLARHLEVIGALQGVWKVARLETDGQPVPPDGFSASTIRVDGDQFVFRSWGDDHLGTFAIRSDAAPMTIDIAFSEGPEAGNVSLGIFRLEEGKWELCLGFAGAERPESFATSPGSGHALQTLAKTTFEAEPCAPAVAPEISFGVAQAVDWSELLGEWSAVAVVANGQALPERFMAFGRRVATESAVHVSFGGQTMVDASIEIPAPGQIDYHLRNKPGQVMHGIFAFDGAHAMFCMSEAGGERPTEFTSEPGSGRTLSVWKLVAASVS